MLPYRYLKLLRHWAFELLYHCKLDYNLSDCERQIKKRRSAHGPPGDFCIASFKNSVSFYFFKKIRKLPSILYVNCL